MCGIAGIMNRATEQMVSHETVTAMCDIIRHRGPDEAGYYIKGNIGLGMRRLKVIDLATGSQPIFNEDKTVVTVFNGEIYNYKKLRRRLESKGHRFYTSTDTEVIVHLYEEYGDDFMSHLNGMFAIALWDESEKKLLLVRDRLGEKPLHYGLTPDGDLVFSSEIKSILTARMIEKELDYKSVFQYFSLIYVPAPHSIYKNIYKLPAGHFLICRNGTVEVEEYWDIRYKPDFSRSEEDFAAELHEKLVNSIRDRLISDVPIGAFLSGGIDSSIVVALMSTIMDRPVKTFSIGFKEDRYNELSYARSVADRYKTDHHEFVVDPKAIDLVEKIVWHFDEPFGGPSAIPTFIVSEMARKYVTVVLTGDGGDEVFGGYDSYMERLKRKRLSIIPKWMRAIIAGGVGANLPPSTRGKGFLQSLDMDENRLHCIGLTQHRIRQMFSADFLEHIGALDAFDIAKEHAERVSESEYLSRFMYLDAKLYLPGNVLVKVDRMSMANSLETRTVFLDHDVVEFAAGIPAGLMIKDGVGKYILKKTAQDLVPRQILKRGKWGFALPVEDWFRGELRGLLTEVVDSSRDTGIFNHAFLKRKVDEHMSGKRNNKRLLWAFMMFQLWHNKCYRTNPAPARQV